MIIVTGAAGFIGSNLVHELNRLGETDILLVDQLVAPKDSNPPSFRNLEGAAFSDYMDVQEFRTAIKSGDLDNLRVRAILHQGACSNTLEDDGRYMMDNNFTCSKEVLHFALRKSVPLIYASTAAVYGSSSSFKEVPSNERPLNIYGFSKLAFDNYVRQKMTRMHSTVVGLRYFNVYGPRELHKGRMASVLHHFTKQIKDTHTIRMFEGSGGYDAGEQRRDFIFVQDIARINLFFAGLLPDQDEIPNLQAIVNAGTGESRSFNDVACSLMRVHGKATIDYIPFPGDLKDRYQHFTQADTTALRQAGYTAPFTPLEEGVRRTFAA